MTSAQRRGSGPVRQHSLQQPARRLHQMRRQRSAEEDRALQIRTSDPIRARRDNERSNVERPKVRIAWGDDSRIGGEDIDVDGRVEVVACQIATSGKSRSNGNGRQPRNLNRNSASEKNCSTILYSRQELAERLRLAWKQREANKSNIDVFLAHGTTEERSDSRLSNSSSVDRSPVRNFDKKNSEVHANKVETKSNNFDKISSGVVNSIENLCRIENVGSAISGVADGARSKRASFKSGKNLAFLELDNEQQNSCAGFLETQQAETIEVTKKECSSSSSAFSNAEKNRRTNSAPPQRRANSVGASCRTQVSIVIEAPSVARPEQELGTSTNCVEANACASSRISGTGNSRPIKSAPAKRRARSCKRRANSAAGKDLEAGRAKVGGNDNGKNSEVVTMVSLISDADSDSEVEQNSPRDDKLISQLRSNLPTMPIIKNSVTTCGSSNSIARRTIKSVSFQQDSIDDEELDKRNVRIRPQSVQVGRVIGSALPTPEEARTWRTEATTLTISTKSTIRQHYENQDGGHVDVSLTDREKRCLVVPIGDPRSDKKRKLLRTRSTPPPRVNGIEKQSTMQQNEMRETPQRSRISAVIENSIPVQSGNSILLQNSVSKLIENVAIQGSNGEPEVDVESVEPAFQTTKEKECWHLYRRMCDKGVCVSFDTVLRGMLTPTEYRLRRKEVT